MQKDHWHNVQGQTGMDITGFGIKKGKLTVSFDNKGKKSEYVYTTDEENLCCRMVQADSIGKYFYRYVRPLPYAKVS